MKKSVSILFWTVLVFSQCHALIAYAEQDDRDWRAKEAAFRFQQDQLEQQREERIANAIDPLSYVSDKKEWSRPIGYSPRIGTIPNDFAEKNNEFIAKNLLQGNSVEVAVKGVVDDPEGRFEYSRMVIYGGFKEVAQKPGPFETHTFDQEEFRAQYKFELRLLSSREKNVEMKAAQNAVRFMIRKAFAQSPYFLHEHAEAQFVTRIIRPETEAEKHAREVEARIAELENKLQKLNGVSLNQSEAMQLAKPGVHPEPTAEKVKPYYRRFGYGKALGAVALLPFAAALVDEQKAKSLSEESGTVYGGTTGSSAAARAQ